MGRRWETGRTEAFGDGVFAIAITLLVLDIRVPASGFDHLAHDIAHELSSYLAYTTSFLAIGLPQVAAFGYLAIAVVSVLLARGDRPADPAAARSA